MIFISYAQNPEDVILWRVLGQFGPGFYIDVGANDPTSDWMTRGFYDLGWRGINVEPVHEHLEDLKKARPRDVNLGIAVGNRPEETEFHESTVKGWSTASAEVAALHRTHGQFQRTVSVPMQTLAAICEQHVPEAIHFLKIDVEGFEKEVSRRSRFPAVPSLRVVVALEGQRGPASAVDQSVRRRPRGGARRQLHFIGRRLSVDSIALHDHPMRADGVVVGV
jgi:FkbM family methyltransferase